MIIFNFAYSSSGVCSLNAWHDMGSAPCQHSPQVPGLKNLPFPCGQKHLCYKHTSDLNSQSGQPCQTSAAIVSSVYSPSGNSINQRELRRISQRTSERKLQNIFSTKCDTVSPHQWNSWWCVTPCLKALHTSHGRSKLDSELDET